MRPDSTLGQLRERERRLRMQTRFMLYFGAVVIALMTAVILLMEHRQSTTLLRQTELRGVAVARSIASVVLQALYGYDYVYLQQAAETAATDESVAYVMILDKEGAIAGYSERPGEVGKLPDDELSEGVRRAGGVLIQQAESNAKLGLDSRFLDIAVPVTGEDSSVKWGTIRIGLSLETMQHELVKTRGLLVSLGLGAIMIVLVAGRFFSRQITQPMEGLASATAAVASGNLDHEVNVDQLGELADLAESFNKMTNDLKRSRDAVRYQNQHLENMVQERTAALREKARELERANAELKELDRLKSDFLSNVSHELRTPLTSIRSFTEILLEGEMGLGAEQRREFLEIISSQSDRLTRLISDLLDLSKIEAGEFHCQLEGLALHDVVRPCLGTLQTLAADKGVMLKAHVDEELPAVLGDFDRLSQVLTNLMDNAIKFTGSDGSVTVRAEKNPHRRGKADAPVVFAGMESDTPEVGHYVIVSVTDTGVGIAKSDQRRIFEKFGQVGNVLTEKPQGTGLGLTICGTIIVQHGGALWVESEPGQGSTFAFSLPVAAEGAELLQANESELRDNTHQVLLEAIDRTSTGPKILVVDDEPAVVNVIQRLLAPEGYEAIGCTDGLQAMDMVREHRPDAILLDVLMPDINGYDVLKMLKENSDTADIPVIVLSGHDDAQTAFELGAAEYIRKPFDITAVLENVRALA